MTKMLPNLNQLCVTQPSKPLHPKHGNLRSFPTVSGTSLYRSLLKKIFISSSFLTTTNRLDHLFDPTFTSRIIVNGCLLNLRIFATSWAQVHRHFFNHWHSSCPLYTTHIPPSLHSLWRRTNTRNLSCVISWKFDPYQLVRYDIFQFFQRPKHAFRNACFPPRARAKHKLGLISSSSENTPNSFRLLCANFQKENIDLVSLSYVFFFSFFFGGGWACVSVRFHLARMF